MHFNRMMDDFMTTYLLKEVPFNTENAENMIELMDDELVELSNEIVNSNMNKANVVKEALDVVYVATQRLRRMGVDVDAGLAEVHRSNMSKALPLDGSVNIDKELEIARERYPNAGLKHGQRKVVLICGDTNKVIKPTTYSPAVITPQMIGE